MKTLPILAAVSILALGACTEHVVVHRTTAPRPVVVQSPPLVAVRQPICSWVSVPIYQEYYMSPGTVSSDQVIVGTIVGAAIGNQVGKGSGRTAATVAGALIGGSIASNQGPKRHYRTVGHTTEWVCQ